VYLEADQQPATLPSSSLFAVIALPSAMVHTLPLEMWGSIIDLLQGDTPTLCSCAVVCKGWTPYAQKALISMAHIRGPGSLPRYTSSDERPPRPDKLPGFREAVERTPSFRDGIHTIVVERLLSGLPRPDPWLRNALPVIESLTSKVEHVRLVSNVHLKDEDILAICQAFRDARRFELADIRLDHESFFQFVNTHALITHLSLFHCSVRQYSESSTEIVQVLPSLVHLEFIGISPDLKGWLLKRDNFPSLRTLAIYRAHSNDEAVLAVEMLKLFGSSLEHLYLNLGYDGIAFFRGKDKRHAVGTKHMLIGACFQMLTLSNC
jgi:hypothetical protein